MVNRVSYLKFLSKNKHSLISDVATVKDQNNNSYNGGGSGSNIEGKMGQLLMLAEDPKAYYEAMQHLQMEQEAAGGGASA
jgi:hypothetical protein